MSSARALANHHLYLARIVLGAWEREAGREELPSQLLLQAFGPGCREQLLAAYGWFMLALAGPDELPAEPPREVADLPERAPGKSVPAEIREFAQLERDGWLRSLLDWEPEAPARARSPGNLVRNVEAGADAASFRGWAEALESLFTRMSDFLDEY